MADSREHPSIPTLKRQLAEGQIDRREFLRYATLLGLSAPAAYAAVRAITGERLVGEARAQGTLPKGGTLRLGMRCQDVKDPHTFSWVQRSNTVRQVCDYLTTTGTDNITRPSLCEKWEASPDLKTWTLRLRKDVKWHNGRQFTADDVVWNIKRVLDPKTGSSVLGLMKGFILEEFETGEKDDKGNPKKSTRLWDANAVQKVDDFTVKLNGKTPQIAVPEWLFHYPFLILDPAENGEFKVGSNGTGAFQLVENQLERKQVLKARKDYWGGGPYLDTIEFIDLGDDSAAEIAALASKQVDGLYEAAITQLDALKKLGHVQLYQATTAQTAVARVHPVKPFDDKRVRQALRYAIDTNAVLQVAHKGLGTVGEHHHVSPIHPEYAKLPAVPAGRREGEEAPGRRRLSERHRHRDRVQAGSGVGAARGAGAGGAVEGSRDPRQDQQHALDPVLGGLDEGPLRLHGLDAPAARDHGPRARLSHGRALERGEVLEQGFRQLLTQAEGTLDVAKRREIMAKLEAILQDDGPIVQPLWRSVFTYMDKRVQGFKMHPTQYIFGNQLGITALVARRHGEARFVGAPRGAPTHFGCRRRGAPASGRAAAAVCSRDSSSAGMWQAMRWPRPEGLLRAAACRRRSGRPSGDSAC